MRSFPIYAALALAGVVDRVAAGRCGPSQTTSSQPTTTRPPVIVTNLLAGGNFAAADPKYRNDIHGFDSDGNCRLVQGQGYQGDGSQEIGCVIMDSRDAEPTNAVSKRQTTDWNAMIEQLLTGLDVTSLYTVRFFYAIVENDQPNTCQIDAYYGDHIFASTNPFPMTSDSGSNYQWREFIQQTPVETSSGLVRFALNCGQNGHAKVLIDQIFMSNQVDPSDVDNISLSYISEVTGPTTSVPSSGTATSSVPSTSTDYCAGGIPSGTCQSVTPPAGDSICAAAGNIIGVPYWASSSSNGPQQSSAEVCAWLCHAQAACVSFGFSAKETQCYYVGSKMSAGYFSPNANSDTIWFDKACMGCCDGGAHARGLPQPQLGSTLEIAPRPTWTTAV
ncbi:hypothetical protein BGZ63DRAFT_386987 [Mariannaea sp. PMI_226]|nr:hypothetical protein BGZ63DRAFT_386987 [Mariannaea sp. PMI_226]